MRPMISDVTGTAYPGESGAPQGATPEPRAAPGRYRLIMRRTALSVRRQLPRPVVQGVLALAIYLAIWLTYAPVRPLLEDPKVPHLALGSMDPNYFVWILRWWPYAISHDLDPLRAVLLTAPGASDLAWTSSVPALGVLAAPLTETMGPVAAFNLLTVLAIPLAGWAAFVLCRRLTRQFWPSLIGGAVFGFSAYELGHSPAGQIDITYTLLLPLITYLVLLWWQRAIGAVAYVALAGLAIAGQFYLFLETFADLSALLGVSLVAGFLVAGRSCRPRVARLAGLTAVAYGLALLLAAPYLYVVVTSRPASLAIHGTNLDLATLAVCIPLFAVAVALAVLRPSRLTWFLLVMLVVIFVAALGRGVTIDGHQYGSFPWAGIWNLPFVRDAYPNRLMVFIYLDLALMAATLPGRPDAGTDRRWPRSLLAARWLMAGAAVVATLVLNFNGLSLDSSAGTSHSGVPALISSGQYRRVLSPGETVAVVSDVGNAGMLWQAETDFYFRLAGGYVGYQFSPGGDLPAQIQDLGGASSRSGAHLVRAFEKYVASARVGAILVQTEYKPWWAGIFRDMGLRGHLAGGVLVYRTDACRACQVPWQRHRHT